MKITITFLFSKIFLYAAEITKENRGAHQEENLVIKKDADQEFIRNVAPLLTCTGVMNLIYQEGVSYDSVVSISDESFGLLLLEDKSLLLGEVAHLRIQKEFCN